MTPRRRSGAATHHSQPSLALEKCHGISSVRPLAVLALVSFLAGCGEDAEASLRIQMAGAGVRPIERVEETVTELSEAQVALGQLLFFDPLLSGNRNIACATCHLPALHAGDGRALAIGEGGSGVGPDRVLGEGEPTLRNAPDIFNRASPLVTALFWDGRLKRASDGSIRSPVPLPEGIDTLLEAQALLPLLDRAEMRGHGAANELAALPDDDPASIWEAIVARVRAVEDYREPFRAAFPGVPFESIRITEIATAIAAFEIRVWDLDDSPFDRFLRREESLSPDAARGAALFFGRAGCANCHDGPLLSDMRFYRVLPAGDDDDAGRADVSGEAADHGAFRTPLLRTVVGTGPWMHDGRFDSLADAVTGHETWSGTEADVELLLAFLDSLTSATERHVGRGDGVPDSVPSGLPVPSLE